MLPSGEIRRWAADVYMEQVGEFDGRVGDRVFASPTTAECGPGILGFGQRNQNRGIADDDVLSRRDGVDKWGQIDR